MAEQQAPKIIETHYDQILANADRHLEKQILKQFKTRRDLSHGTIAERVQASLTAIQQQEPLLYKPLLLAPFTWEGGTCEILIQPDLLVYQEDGYHLRYIKMARHINRDSHPEILALLHVGHWVFEQIMGQPPAGQELYLSHGHLTPFELVPTYAVAEELEHLLRYKTAQQEPYSPVSWTKCRECRFNTGCWGQAESDGDIALLTQVEPELIVRFRELGVHTLTDLLAHFDHDRLTQFNWTSHRKERRMGAEKAHLLLHTARVLLTREAHFIKPPNLPPVAHFVLFDLEGIPAQFRRAEMVYLWGMQVYGLPSEPQPRTVANFSYSHDRATWNDFLKEVQRIFEQYGDIPFVHWGSFEKQGLDMYARRFGDRRGIVKRIKRNLLDLLVILRECAILPVPSYSLKVVEKFLGFERSQTEYGGYWAVLKYLKAAETRNNEKQQQMIQELIAYNQEDLEAMGVVLQWLQQHQRASTLPVTHLQHSTAFDPLPSPDAATGPNPAAKHPVRQDSKAQNAMPGCD